MRGGRGKPQSAFITRPYPHMNTASGNDEGVSRSGLLYFMLLAGLTIVAAVWSLAAELN